MHTIPDNEDCYPTVINRISVNETLSGLLDSGSDNKLASRTNVMKPKHANSDSHISLGLLDSGFDDESIVRNVSNNCHVEENISKSMEIQRKKSKEDHNLVLTDVGTRQNTTSLQHNDINTTRSVENSLVLTDVCISDDSQQTDVFIHSPSLETTSSYAVPSIRLKEKSLVLTDVFISDDSQQTESSFTHLPWRQLHLILFQIHD